MTGMRTGSKAARTFCGPQRSGSTLLWDTVPYPASACLASYRATIYPLDRQPFLLLGTPLGTYFLRVQAARRRTGDNRN
eukprot:6211969-Pleurochrysis_carterae.AAC.5